MTVLDFRLRQLTPAQRADGERIVAALLPFAEFAYDATDLNRAQSRVMLAGYHKLFAEPDRIREFEYVVQLFSEATEYERWGDHDFEFGGDNTKAQRAGRERRESAEHHCRSLVTRLLRSDVTA